MRCADLKAATMPVQASESGLPPHLLQIEPRIFRECFDRKPFLISHELTNHPLFEISRLMRLCQSLPETSVEYNAGNIPISVAPDKTPGNGLSAEETIRRIAECKSWLVLKYVEQEPEYRALLNRCLAEIARHSEPVRPGMCLAQGFIFISSPEAVTPYHMDPEHNFLLQIRGGKRIHLFDGHDRSILSEEELEQFYFGAHRNLAYPTDFERTGWTFDLSPGFGLHFPVTAPHHVRNGAEVSVSFSITFRTPDLKRRRLVHIYNAFLRRRGLRPTPVGVHPGLDTLKYLSSGVALRGHRMVGEVRRFVTQVVGAASRPARQR
jgi:Cupin-like domain